MASVWCTAGMLCMLTGTVLPPLHKTPASTAARSSFQYRRQVYLACVPCLSCTGCVYVCLLWQSHLLMLALINTVPHGARKGPAQSRQEQQSYSCILQHVLHRIKVSSHLIKTHDMHLGTCIPPGSLQRTSGLWLHPSCVAL